MQFPGNASLLPDANRRGDRLVCFDYCISLIFITLRRTTRVYRLPAGALGLWRALPPTLVSLLLGWWGLPWGVLYTPLTIITNLSGGRVVPAECSPAAAPLAD